MRMKISICLAIALVIIASYGQEINIDLDVDKDPATRNSAEENKNGQSSESNEESIENVNPSKESINLSDDSGDASPEEPEESSPEASLPISSDAIADDSVQTDYGPVIGQPWKYSSNILGFIDIPYGKIGTLFQEPLNPNEWEAPLNNKEHSKHCPQVEIKAEHKRTVLEVTGELNCLTLSVFAHKDVENASVLFHIHDGNFVSGSGDPLIYGPDYLVTKDIILVLPNYRLGPLGFLCLQDEIAPGNAALRDLTLALNWTKSNIAAFGGNPDNIVVSGEGSSAALAEYLAISPTSRDFVSKVITESGSLISHWAIDRHPNETAAKLEDMIRNANPEVTFNENFYEDIDMHMLLLGTYGEHFRPCIDNYTNPFLTQTPWFILHEQNIDIPFMLGTASHAGLHAAMEHVEHSLSTLNENFGSFLPDDLEFEEGEKENVAEKVKTYYFGDDTIDINQLDKLAEFFTDASYLGPAIRTARALVEAGATVYYYEFAFVGDLNKQLILLGENALNVSARGDIVGYLFSQEGHQPEAGSTEEKMVKMMTNLWINFIENGKPTYSDVEWKKLTSTRRNDEDWLYIDSEPEAKKGIHVDRQQLWDEIYQAHFIERNVARAISTRYPTLAIAALSLLGLLSRPFK